MRADKPKILHIALIHGGGGVEIYTRGLINKTNHLCENILICASDYNLAALQEPIKYYHIDVPREISLWVQLLAAKQVRAIIKKEKPDIVYCHSSMGGVVGRVAAIGMGCKVLYNAHGWSFNMHCAKTTKRLYVAIERIMALFTQQIITISEYEKQIALTHKICKAEKIRVVLNGVDPEACRAAAVDRSVLHYTENDFVVACCGRISEEKDPVLFAEVAGVIAKKCPDAKFLWVGDGPMAEQFVTALKRNDVYEKTTLTGMVDDPCRWISAADVTVLLSKWEGFGLVLVEYLALGKPVVATDVCAIPEIIEDGVNGTLLNSRAPETIAQAILAYKDLEDKEQFSARCLACAEAFSVEKTVSGNVAVYEQLLMGNK